MANQYTGKELTFTCAVKRLMFKNEENQYKIYAMTPDPNNSKDVVVDPRYGTVTIIGDKIFDLEPYIQYIVKGKEVTTKYGTSYEVVSIQTKPLETYLEKFGYLSSVLTSLQARTLLSEYPDIINQVRNDRNFEPDYSKLPGITAKRFQKIREKIDANYEYADICGTFYDTMSLAIIKRLKKQYDTVDKIKEVFSTDPYKALCAVDGIGFKKADKICLDIENAANEARKNNQVPSYEFPFPVKDSVQRCRACALYCLEEIENSDGSTRINLEDLKGKMAILIDEAIQYFSEVIQDKELFFVHPEFETVSLISTYNKEKYIVRRLEEALQIENKWEYNSDFISTVNGSPLTDEQMQTQKELLDNNIVLLTGSAGAGKSFSMKAVIEMLDKANKSYLLLSPTAKAAKVLEAATSRSASTIHRGLGVNYDLTFLHNESNPILSDVVIVDEFSMVDTDLFYNLLKAIDFQKTKLLLVFDPAQLSSVGPGNLAYDLVQSDLFAGVSLNQIFRYSEGGLITVATDTRNCKPFLPKSARFKITKMGKSFVFIPSDNEWCVEGVVGLYQERLKRGDTTSDLIVISARNTGPQGTIEINKQIQRAINPQPADQIITIPKDGTEIEYRLNDVVMQTANDYHSIVCDPDGSYLVNDDGDPENEVLVANGESGIITRVEKDFVVIKYDDYFIRRDKEDLQRTQLGYAISCHRSQGSGYKNVIIVAPSAHTWQLNSNLLYVGFTRAQEHCWCIGSIDTVNKAVTKKMESTRKTNVSWLLAKLYDKLEEEDEE